MASLSNTWLALLLDVSLKSLLLALVAGAALAVLRVRNTNIRHRVWTGVLLGMIVLPALTVVVPSLPLPASLSWAFALNEPEETAHARAADPASPSDINAPAGVVVDTTQASRPFVDEPARAEKDPNDAGRNQLAQHTPKKSPANDDSQNDSAEAGLSTSTAVPPRLDSGTKPKIWPVVVLAIYAFGLAFSVLRFFIGIWGARRLVGRAQPIPHDHFGISAGKGELLSRVQILESSGVRFPLTVGWWWPKILLPADWKTWGQAKRRSVLAHESAHIERRDYLVTLVAECNRCLYWFHPLAWCLRNWLLRLAERACDDAVIASTGERGQYARHLLELASELAGRRDRLVRVAAIPMARTADVEARITAILDSRRPLARRIGRLGIALLVAAAAPAVLFAAALRPASEQAPNVPDATQSQPAPNESPTTGGNEAAEDKSTEDSTKEEVDRPKVLEVFPKDGATEVEPDTEIRVRFDRAMDPLRGILEWGHDNQGGYRIRGQIRYDKDTNEFVLPVRLTPGCLHQLSMNREDYIKEGEYSGFCSEAQIAAKKHSWSFTTKGFSTTADAQRPKVVATDPPSDSEISLMTLVKVKFDRPMDPTWYGLADCYPDARLIERPELCQFVQYDPETYEFTLPLQMPRNWNGEIELVHFRDKEGLEAKPVRLKFRTVDDAVGASLEERIASVSKSPELISLVDRTRSARAKLTSVSEEVQWALTFGSGSGWLTRYASHGAVFKMQGKRQFMANVDQIMGIPFRVGSDGTNCWFRREDELTTCPFDEMTVKNVLFCDPFSVEEGKDAAAVVEELKLQYMGEFVINGRPCHRVRSWAVELRPVSNTLSPVRDWYIDAETLLPIRFVASGLTLCDYRYTRINEPIPDEEFQPEKGPGIKAKDLDPLDEKYTRRFLNVMDGTNGHMSVRWGKLGVKGGRSSSGLN